jgi:hypothetical protein
MGANRIFGHSAKSALILGNSEFGEVYHAGLAMLYDPQLHIEIEPGSRQVIFASFLDAVTQAAYQFDPNVYSNIGRVSIGRAAVGQVKNERKISKTTKVITRNEKVDPAPAIHLLQRLMTYRCEGFIASRLGEATTSGVAQKRILIWIRNEPHNEPARNTTPPRLEGFLSIVRRLNCQPVLVGAKPNFALPSGIGNLIEFYTEFPGPDTILNQLAMFKLLKEKFSVVAQLGMQSGGMDGPAFFLGIPTASLVFHAKWQRTPRLSQVRGLSAYRTFIWSDTGDRQVPGGKDETFKTFEAQLAPIAAALEAYVT